MPLSAKFNLALKAEYTGVGDIGTPIVNLNLEQQILLANGTAAAQADKIFADGRSIAASSSDDLDLAGVLTDPLGAVLTFAKIKGIVIRAGAANPADLVLGNAATNPVLGIFGAATHTLNIPAGGSFVWLFPGAGKTVTAGTGDLLRIASGAGGTSTYDIMILGTSV